MTKKDLKNGMIVETRKGTRYLYCEGVMRGLDEWDLISSYTDNLKCTEFPQLDIVKVYKDTKEYNLSTIFEHEYLELIWKRPETPKLSEREIEVLKALDVLGFKYIARTIYGDIFTYIAKPVKDKSSWLFNGNDLAKDMVFFRLKRDLFSFVTWVDEEPISIKKLLEQVKEKNK